MKRNKLNKFLASICLILLTPIFLNAQNNKPKNLPNYDNEPYHYGFIVGYNQLFFSPTYTEGFQSVLHNMSTLPNLSDYSAEGAIGYNIYGINPGGGHGFTVGIVGNLRMAKHFDLRLIPSLSFGHRTVNYDINVVYENGESKLLNPSSKTDHVCIEIPLHVKCRSKRYNNSAAYIFTGANYKFDMYSRKNMISQDIPLAVITKRHDIAAEVGAGFDFYTGYFKLGVEVKMSYGLIDVAEKDAFMFTNSFDSLRNKTFQLSFTFE